MNTPDRFAVIIPAFNEGERIRDTISAITARHDAEVVVVDDGSHDDTTTIASAAGATVLRLPFNLGYGAALQSGFKYARRKGYRYVVQMDADGQHDPSYIPDLLERVTGGEADVIIGSRFLEDTGYRMPLARRLGVRIFSAIVSLVTGRTVKDPTSGYQALNEKALKLYASNAYPVDFPDADVLIMLHKRKLTFKEFPLVMKPNPKQITMHSGIKTVYYIFKMFLSIFVTLLRKEQ